MPVIAEKDGYKLFFYSNDHTPIHIHIRKGGGEAIFDVENIIELRESHGFKVQELSKAQDIANEFRDLIIGKWNEHFNRQS